MWVLHPSPLQRRMIIIVGLMALNIVLGIEFIKQSKIQLPPTVINLAGKVGLKLPQLSQHDQAPLPSVQLDPKVILELTNAARLSENKPELVLNDQLNQAAQLLLNEFSAKHYAIDQGNYQTELRDALTKTKFAYQQVTDIAVVGPVTSREVYDAWMESETQREALMDDKLTATGIATASTIIDGVEVGVAVQILAEPQRRRSQSTPATHQTTTEIVSPSAPEIPDTEVVAALNNYRANHQRPPLRVDDFLCQYAEKRVRDLEALGKLDGHAGFKADFADGKAPEGLRDYDGRTFGENLASQFCINGTTNQSFTATTGTALIEWCFDSSQTGHREAQLSTEYRSVCARHGSNMYVVIFAD